MQHRKHDTNEDSVSAHDAAKASAMAMQKYFGPLRNSDIETFASDAFAHETHNLPRAYVGRNRFLMATIDFLMTSTDDWYTKYILPWLYTEELHVKWNIWRFNRTMMDYEPEQGVPRYVTYESESRSDSLVRRGLAFIIEHGFYKTEIGRQHYLMNLKQIVEAVHETVYYGVIHELLAAPNFYNQWNKKHRPHSIVTNDAITTLAEERWRFACVQKDIKGLFVLDAEIKDRMRRVGIEPDSWIFPSKMAIYASMVPEYLNEYSRGGARATTALEDGAKRFDTFRGTRVFETRSFDTDFMAEHSVEPLVRTREIGEYYILGENMNDFKHGIRVFDMSRDKFHTISYHKAKEHALKAPAESKNAAVKQLKAFYAAGLEFKNVVRDVFGFNLPDGKLDVNDQDTPDSVKNFYKNIKVDMPNSDQKVSEMGPDQFLQVMPLKVILFRPRMTYRMGTAILAKGGEELGQTLHGHHDFQLTDDVIHKTHIGHYTFYSKSVVREPKNMYLAEDVYCTGYDGGENTTFMDRKNPDMTAPMNAGSGSLLAAFVPMNADIPACVSLAGSLSAHHAGLQVQSDLDSWTGSELLKDLCDAVSDTAEVTKAPDDDEAKCNGICFRGAEEEYDDKNGCWTTRQRNTGHWGPNVYDGCANVRLGMYAHLKDIGK